MAKSKEEKPAEKYIKRNPRLYQEPYKDGKPFNWFKQPRYLDMQLFDLQHIVAVSLEGEGDISAEMDMMERQREIADLVKPESSNIDDETFKELRNHAAKTVATEGKKTKVSSAIKARAVFPDRTINIFEDGQISKARFRTAEFICKEGGNLGYMAHNAGDMLNYDRYHNAPYISIETYLPSELFQSLLQQIKEEKVTEAHAYVQVDVFQSEVERSLAEPWMQQDYTIEAESYDNYCGIVSIRLNTKQYLPSPRDEYIEDDTEPVPQQQTATPEIQLMTLLVGELRHTNKILKAIAIALFLIAVFYLFKH
jgi:hypothetical protein